jgi:hypothetical protein
LVPLEQWPCETLQCLQARMGSWLLLLICRHSIYN